MIARGFGLTARPNLNHLKRVCPALDRSLHFHLPGPRGITPLEGLDPRASRGCGGVVADQFERRISGY